MRHLRLSACRPILKDLFLFSFEYLKAGWLLIRRVFEPLYTRARYPKRTFLPSSSVDDSAGLVKSE